VDITNFLQATGACSQARGELLGPSGMTERGPQARVGHSTVKRANLISVAVNKEVRPMEYVKSGRFQKAV
jgi:hypothetical protein